MLFSSIEFLIYFLPIFMIVYAVTPLRLRGVILLIGSVVFYGKGAGVEITLLFLCLILINYLGAFWISSCRKNGRAIVLTLFLVIDFGCLIYFKYMGFFIREMSSVFPYLPELVKNIMPAVLPLGISFIVFQFAAYLIDVYRRDIRAERNLLIFTNYNMAFPKVLMGPICRLGDMKTSLEKPEMNWKDFEKGLSYFIVGMAFKVIIADRLSPVWADIQKIGYESITTSYAWIGAVCYSLQLYFDFNGYSLMALGLGKMIGIGIPQNFDLPYMSRSVSEFYRRWHMTLGQWFKDYIYIPMGGNRKGVALTILNLTVVWVITGLWHGDNRNFLLWGVYLLVFILLEKFLIGKFLKIHNIFSHVYTVIVILFSWIIFAITDVKEIFVYFSRMIPVTQAKHIVFADDYIFSIKSCWWVILLGVFFCLPFGRKAFEKYGDQIWFKVLLLAVFWIAVYMTLQNTGNPFMYFKF